MKKIVFIVAVLLPMLSQAQFTKGDIVLGGTLSLYSYNQATNADGEAYRSSYLSALPNLGILINERLEVGGLLGYSSSSQNTKYPSYDETSKSKSITTGLYAQQYLTLTEKFLFAFLVQSHFSRGNNIRPEYDPSTADYVDIKTQHYSINSSFRPTFLFFPSPQWGFELSLASLNHVYNSNLSTDAKSNQFTLSYGSVNLGFSYYFRKSGE